MDEISRFEKILRGDPIEPVSRLEIFAAMAAGTWTGDPLTPVTRLEYFLSQISGGGGGGETKSTLIMPADTATTSYSGDVHYSLPYQKQTAPEGIVYDKVWMSDEFITGRAFDNTLETIFVDCAMTTYRFSQITSVKNVLISGTRNNIGTYCFTGCSNLKNIVLFKTGGIVSLSNTNAFNSTPIAAAGSGVTLWVPSDLISSYATASNWSTLFDPDTHPNNSIQAIEGSIYE